MSRLPGDRNVGSCVYRVGLGDVSTPQSYSFVRTLSGYKHRHAMYLQSVAGASKLLGAGCCESCGANLSQMADCYAGPGNYLKGGLPKLNRCMEGAFGGNLVLLDCQRRATSLLGCFPASNLETVRIYMFEDVSPR